MCSESSSGFSVINIKSVSAIYSGLTFCSRASIQALSLSGSATKWPPDHHIPSSLELEVIIMQTLHFRIATVDPPGAAYSFQVAYEYDS